MDKLAFALAQEAQALNLSVLNIDRAEPDILYVFTRRVLEELAARGLVEGEQEIGCWAAPRSNHH